MTLPHPLTPDFTLAVDDLIQNVTFPDSTLHSRAQQYLDVFNHTTPGQVSVRPTWSERIHVPSPVVWPGTNPNNPPPPRHPFTTPGLFNAMYAVADELNLVGGKRYVSAAICVCAEHAAQAHAAAGAGLDSEMRGALVRALHQLSSTWAAFLLWPFYAHGQEEPPHKYDRHHMPGSSGDETPTAETTARAQRRRLKELVLARDNCRCFLSSGLDYSAYTGKGMSLPPGVTRVSFCRTVSIIPPEVLAQPDTPEARSGIQPTSDQEITSGILQRFCSVKGATPLAEQAQGPANTLLVHGWGASAFSMFLWWLLPTETPDRYAIKNPDPMYDIGHGIPPPTHVAFADHSASAPRRSPASRSNPIHGVDLPSPVLLRTRAALAEVLHRSGAMDAFETLRLAGGAGCSRRLHPAATGSAFWRSVVEYEGPEVCLEVGLREAADALARKLESAGLKA